MHDDKLEDNAVLIPLLTGYIDKTQKVSFPKGAVSGGVNSKGCLSVPIVDDYRGENAETFQVGIWKVYDKDGKFNASLPPPVDVTIVDDDGKHADSDATHPCTHTHTHTHTDFQISKLSYTVSEGQGPVEVCVEISPTTTVALPQDVTMKLATKDGKATGTNIIAICLTHAL